jgi:hypothetical protein
MIDSAKEVYKCLVDFKNEYDGVQPPLSYIEFKTGLVRSHINKIINGTLVKNKLVEIEYVDIGGERPIKIIRVVGGVWLPPLA